MATSLEELVTCSICMDLYKEPLALPCLHSFCKRCLKGLTASSFSLQCPECRKIVKLDRKGLDGLPRNFQLASIVESYEKDHGNKEEEIKEENPRLPYCSAHRQTCDFTCKACGVPVCVKCIPEEHRGHKMTYTGDKGTEALPLSETITNTACSRHRLDYKMYCTQCEALACAQCVTSEHNAHALSSMQDVYAYNASILDSLLRELSDKQKVLKKAQKIYRTHAQKSQNEAQKHRQELSRYFHGLRDLLDKREADLKRELDSKEKQTVEKSMKRADEAMKRDEHLTRVMEETKRLLTEEKAKFLQTFKGRSSKLSTLLEEDIPHLLDQPSTELNDVTLVTCNMEKDVSAVQWKWPKAVERTNSNKRTQNVSKAKQMLREVTETFTALEVGNQVQRGKDWKSGMEDGGPGHFGTVTQTTLDGVVFKVRWPNGRIGEYRYNPPWEFEIYPP